MSSWTLLNWCVYLLSHSWWRATRCWRNSLRCNYSVWFGNFNKFQNIYKYFRSFRSFLIFSCNSLCSRPMVLKFVLLSDVPGIMHPFSLNFTTNSGYNFRLLAIFTFGDERGGGRFEGGRPKSGERLHGVGGVEKFKFFVYVNCAWPLTQKLWWQRSSRV